MKEAMKKKNVCADSNIQAEYWKSIRNKPIVGSNLSTVRGISTSLTLTPTWVLYLINHLVHGPGPGTHMHTLVSFITRAGNERRLKMEQPPLSYTTQDQKAAAHQMSK